MSGLATAVAGGRRREALLRHHADQEREQRLSAADVDVLQRDRSPQARAQVAAKFGRQFDELCGASDQAVATAVLELLVRDLAVEVRQALASTVATSTSCRRRSRGSSPATRSRSPIPSCSAARC